MLASFPTESLSSDEDFAIDEEAMTAVLDTLSCLCADIPFPAAKTGDYRYYFENPAFSYGDATIYFGMLRWLRPSRVIEVGCGFSSCVGMDTNDLFLEKSIDFTFVDPFPEVLLSLIDPGDSYINQIVKKRLQDVDVSLFEQLETDDIIHRFLPRLKIGI